MGHILLGVTSHAMMKSYSVLTDCETSSETSCSVQQRNECWPEQGTNLGFQAYNNRLSPLHHLGCWFFTCTFLNRWKTNSQDGVVDSTCCRMLRTLGSIPAVLNILSAVALSNLYRNLSRNVKKYDRSVATIVGKSRTWVYFMQWRLMIARLVDCETWYTFQLCAHLRE